jgi:RNA polymerase-binding transcription factor DksA
LTRYKNETGSAMAGGWARDGAEQEQIDATIYDAIAKARQGLSHNEDGEAALYCEECGEPIPQARLFRWAVIGSSFAFQHRLSGLYDSSADCL